MPSANAPPPARRGSNSKPTPPGPSPAETETALASTPTITTTTVATNDAESNPNDPLAGLPPLTYEPATTASDRTAGLKLIADSVAQRRQAIASALIRSPLVLATLVALFGIAYAALYRAPEDWIQLFVSAGGIGMAVLAAVRLCVSGYLSLAEETGWEWLGSDELVVARFGKEVIGAAVLRVEREAGGSGSRKKKVGVLRAWTVRTRERGRGVGFGLLEGVVAYAIRECGVADMRFAAGAEEGLAGRKKGEREGEGEVCVIPSWLEGLTGVERVLREKDDGADEVLRHAMKEVKAKGSKR